MNEIYVTKTYLPEREKYDEILDKIWQTNYVTNHGPYGEKLESALSNYLDCPHVHWLSNGTVALQLAIHCLNLKGEILTTPFTYVATANSIMWEKCTPVFVDIDPHTFAIDHKELKKHITSRTSAILAVHIYGYPAPVKELQEFSDEHNLKLIYDGAHAFGSFYTGKSLANFGDITTLSFHATKVFHTIEGGAVVTNIEELSECLSLGATHGHRYEEYIQEGINAKNSELHAGIGLLNLKNFQHIVNGRKKVFEHYLSHLNATVLYILKPDYFEDFTYNYAYFPVVFPSEMILLQAEKSLNKENIFPRRYFYPALNTLPYLNTSSCPVAEDISKRILCLPLYHDLPLADVDRISIILKKNLP
ncbi:DegT/DnrJ/EryC1/StrS family aminotransferase [Flavimarina sp. Hel_I_48]|uniref:DegT/DnrJ/EryC1/StrS family aminotransferase n=1 Tax=Flavimarina sp. Hel_I_48 TaxID=1392488 RepID=UPI0004DEE825|nr:DegT/DnrJ/EryC1/StrS family aminotransferase [Flavimarina sp. Hel_I_48]